tara:strand:- start:240182 stop:240619 length:438 start_codon:yes stop_codon:yes gene_type:complete
MTTREEIRGNWNQLRGRIEERWGQLTSNDLDELEGKADQLVGKIQQKTGETSQKIEAELDAIIKNLSESASCASERIGESVKKTKEQLAQVSESAREQYERVSETVQDGYQQAEHTVRKHPAESVAVAFGTGLIAGVIVGLVWRK